MSRGLNNKKRPIRLFRIKREELLYVFWAATTIFIFWGGAWGWSEVLENQKEKDRVFFQAYQDALVAFKRLKLEEAQKAISRAMELRPNDPRAIVLAARIYLKQKDYERAEKELYKVFKIQPDYGPAYQYLGEVFFAKKDFKEALYRFEQAALHDPMNKEILLKRIYCEIGLGRLLGAENLLSELSAFDEASPGYYFARAALCRVQKKYADEKNFLDTARIIYGNDAFSQYLADYESLFAKKQTLN
ncbi:hypothetical protein A7K93_07240 [Candidatus Methylacidiphilum fumarolicum]|uniref:Uncharacterized protein n=2 Tax=Candidatus Methylacidiphilum fumarolicum TaxID=591154 RepID=I0JY32_METFB|nr:tetratricopeptide repeat protein [Candidatus Methylacidiphilum fumarolicum]CCG92151.1 exported hypothetical protein [Methylacidiphilum fumariolicum SolV]TFE68465.1 hypothetical protein A7K73_07825 [Candidatus Methylacidiphilum fumarolicum]TFE73069.1 hypothetical protein A7K93_07240 [Candidatus Methylacidiphilum fumarolicum]TFE73125.1 hypothetical protein A7K72_07270 [Candidatus Methylacidiphilum fumarolicum]